MGLQAAARICGSVVAVDHETRYLPNSLAPPKVDGSLAARSPTFPVRALEECFLASHACGPPAGAGQISLTIVG